MKYCLQLLICLLFFFFNTAFVLSSQNSKSSLQLFPQNRLFLAKIADPREVQLSARILFNRNEFAGNIGYSVGVLEFNLNRLPIQLRIEGNTLFVSKVRKPDFPMQSADYTIAFPFDTRIKSFSARLKWTHISSHLGDDFNRIENVHNSLERFGNEYSYFSKPKKFSREFLEIFGSFDRLNNRFYSGLIWAYHITRNRSDDRPFAPITFQFGYECFNKIQNKVVKPFMAMDAKLKQQFNWQPDLNLQLGMIIGTNQLGRMRIALEVYNGFSNQGQFYNRKDKDVNFLLAFDF